MFLDKLQWTFTPNEQHYIKAWKSIFRGTRDFKKPEQLVHIPKGRIGAYVSNTVHQGYFPDPFALSANEKKVLSEIPFKSVSKLKQESRPVIQPRRFLEICPEAEGKKRWKKFWKKMYHQEWTLRRDLTALHQFNVGSYVPVHDTKGREIIPCLLCGRTGNSQAILNHIYNFCESSKFWWQQIGFRSEMHLREMLAPIDTSSSNLRNLNLFVKVVYRAFIKRRREFKGGVDISPLLVRQLSRALGQTTSFGR